MIMAYMDVSLKDFPKLTSYQDRRRHLFYVYTQRMFQRRGGNKPYENDTSRDWLAYLARKMKLHDQTIFLIERLQPTWLNTKKQSDILRLILGVSIGLLTGPFLGWGANVIFGFSLETALAITFYWVVHNVIIAIFDLSDIFQGDIQPIELIKLSGNKVAPMLLASLLVGLIFSLFGAISGFFSAVIGGRMLAALYSYLLTGSGDKPDRWFRSQILTPSSGSSAYPLSYLANQHSNIFLTSTIFPKKVTFF